MANKCSDCVYGQFVGEEDYGSCRRYPPSVKASTVETEVDSSGQLLKGLLFRRHIRVYKDDVCGEFSA
jgi:hypothetical protein